MVHACFFLSSGLCVLAGTLWQVVSRCNEHSVPTYVPFCSGQSAGHWSYYNFPRELLRTPLLPNLNFGECPKGEVRRISLRRSSCILRARNRPPTARGNRGAGKGD